MNDAKCSNSSIYRYLWIQVVCSIVTNQSRKSEQSRSSNPGPCTCASRGSSHKLSRPLPLQLVVSASTIRSQQCLSSFAFFRISNTPRKNKLEEEVPRQLRRRRKDGKRMRVYASCSDDERRVRRQGNVAHCGRTSSHHDHMAPGQ